MKKSRLFGTVCACVMGIGLFMGLITVALAQPVVPGFDVEVYATMSQPGRLAFDPSGVLYVGTNLSPAKIYRVAVGGSPVEQYGDTPLSDPDSVAFDASGAISGTAGSVLVGGAPGHISAILPDQTTEVLFAPGTVPNLENPQALKFDRVGRLVIIDVFSDMILVSTGGAPNTLFPAISSDTFAIDQANRIFAQNGDRGLQIISPDGSTAAAFSDFSGFITGLEYSPYDAIWDGDLVAISRTPADLYKVDNNGQFDKIGGGFVGGALNDVAFGPDGALYVSDTEANAIYRITPAEVTFVPTDDAKLRSRSASKNFGRSGNLRVRHDEWESCLKFQVTTPSSDSATLRLYATDGSPDGGTIYQAANDWAESSVSYSSKPAFVSGPLDSAGAVFDDTWVELDVSSVVTGAGTYSFCLVSDSSNSVFYSSRERSQAPELVVEFEY